MTYVVSLAEPSLAYFHEKGFARAGKTPEAGTGYVVKDFEQFKGCIQKQGLPELIIYDYSFTQQLEHAASINAELRQVPAVVIFGGNHNRLPETQLNRIYTVDVTQQSAQDIHAMIERFQNMLASNPASADKTCLIKNKTMAGNQPQV